MLKITKLSIRRYKYLLEHRIIISRFSSFRKILKLFYSSSFHFSVHILGTYYLNTIFSNTLNMHSCLINRNKLEHALLPVNVSQKFASWFCSLKLAKQDIGQNSSKKWNGQNDLQQKWLIRVHYIDLKSYTVTHSINNRKYFWLCQNPVRWQISHE